MTPLRRERIYRYSVALAMLYGLLAVRYLVLEGDPSRTPYLQALVLGWAFAVMAVLSTILPTTTRPPHLQT